MSLSEHLAPWLHHSPGCAAHNIYDNGRQRECDCGLDAARAEGVAALQQVGEPISRENLEAELRETIGLYVREAVTRMFSEENATYRCARQIAGMLQPGYYLHRKLFSSPLPQQTALVEQGVEKIIGPHEPAACGEGTLPSPSVPQRSAGKCSTCRHFTPEASSFGSCARWRTGYGMGAVDLASDEVLVENDEGWGMLMGPDFGCVLHDPAPGGEKP